MALLTCDFQQGTATVSIVATADPSRHGDIASFSEQPRTPAPRPKKQVDSLGYDWSRRIDAMLAPAWQISALVQLGGLKELEYNWDGYNSKPISAEIRAVAAELLTSVHLNKVPFPSISPSPGGGIQIEWQVNLKALELHISPTLAAEFAIFSPGIAEREGTLNVKDHAHLERLLASII